MGRALFSVVLKFMMAVGIALPAGAQVSDLDREILVDFYLAAGGDDWVRNDGWLDDDADVCDWYGIDCQFRNEVDRDVLRRLELPANNLTGTLDARIFEMVHSLLDLSDNDLGGELDMLPRSPGQVDLSNNKLSGTLPMALAQQAGEVSGSSLPNSIWYLDLSGNDFEGEVPANWTGTIWLSLANNQLEGLPLSLFDQEMHPASARFLDLSDNRFSGSWFDPSRDGEGISFQLLEGGGSLLYWFTVDDEGGQRWLFQVGNVFE